MTTNSTYLDNQSQHLYLNDLVKTRGDIYSHGSIESYSSELDPDFLELKQLQTQFNHGSDDQVYLLN